MLRPCVRPPMVPGRRLLWPWLPLLRLTRAVKETLFLAETAFTVCTPDGGERHGCRSCSFPPAHRAARRHPDRSSSRPAREATTSRTSAPAEALIGLFGAERRRATSRHAGHVGRGEAYRRAGRMHGHHFATVEPFAGWQPSPLVALARRHRRSRCRRRGGQSRGSLGFWGLRIHGCMQLWSPLRLPQPRGNKNSHRGGRTTCFGRPSPKRPALIKLSIDHAHGTAIHYVI